MASEQLVIRRIPVTPAKGEQCVAVVHSLKGVEDAWVEGRQLVLQYDATQIGVDEIESALFQAGMMRSGLYWHIKRAYYRYVDDTIRANSANSAPSCCSNPHDVYANRKKR